jgi:hypothetical protein
MIFLKSAAWRGVLGESFLQRFEIAVDYQEQMLEISDP